MHEGHRKRMLERVAEAEKLQDHELLEVILYAPVPRKNTNEIAHRLLGIFGSLQNVLAASEDELMRIEGVGACTARYIKSVAELCRRVSDRVQAPPEAYSFGNFSAYVAERFLGLREEVVDLYCLDRSDRIKHTARFTSEEARRVELTVNDVSRLLLARRPQGIVVAHNHPEGTCRPSLQDDEFTAQLMILCSLNKIRLRDHIITGEDGMYSYFTHGRLEEMERAYAVENIIGAKVIQ